MMQNQNESNSIDQTVEKKNNAFSFLKSKLVKAVFILLICYSTLTVMSSLISGKGIISSLIEAIFPILFTIFLGLAIYANNDDLQKRMNSISITYKVKAIIIWVLFALAFIGIIRVISMTGNLKTILESQGLTKEEIEVIVNIVHMCLIFALFVVLVCIAIFTIYNINMLKLLKGMTEAVQSGKHIYYSQLKIVKIFSLVFGIIVGISALSLLSSINTISNNSVVINQYIDVIQEYYGYDISAYVNTNVMSVVLNFFSNAVLSAIYIVSYVILQKLEKEVIYHDTTNQTNLDINQMHPF